MGHIEPGTWDMFADIAAINRWLDEANADTAEEDSMRVMKIGEEIGEAREVWLSLLDVKYGGAIAAYIGMTGQNPRKGKTHSEADLLMELADVAITALCAMQHFTGNRGITEGMLAAKMQNILVRSGIKVTEEMR